MRSCPALCPSQHMQYRWSLSPTHPQSASASKGSKKKVPSKRRIFRHIFTARLRLGKYGHKRYPQNYLKPLSVGRILCPGRFLHCGFSTKSYNMGQFSTVKIDNLAVFANSLSPCNYCIIAPYETAGVPNGA